MRDVCGKTFQEGMKKGIEQWNEIKDVIQKKRRVYGYFLYQRSGNKKKEYEY